MPNLVSFADFQAATRDVKVTPKENLLNEALKNNYFLSEMLRGRGNDKRFQGGTKLVEKIQGDTNGSFAFYSPNDEFSPSQTDTLRTVEAPWAFAKSEYVYTDETTVLNAGDPNAYIDLKKSYELACAVDTVNGMEAALWATPSNSTMESAAADPRVAYSIPAFVTSDGNMPSGFSTLMNLSATANTWWKNKANTYTAATPDDTEAGLIAALDDIVLQVQFDMPTGLPGQKWSDNDSKRKQVICTNRDGVVFYKSRLRAANDRMESLKDPGISGPQFEGLPVIYVAQLDSAGWSSNQPNYYVLNLTHLFPVFHSEWFMKEKQTDGGAKQPNTHVTYKFTWYNLFCRSRRRQGYVAAA